MLGTEPRALSSELHPQPLGNNLKLQLLNFLSQDPIILLKTLSTPQNFCLYELYLCIFTDIFTVLLNGCHRMLGIVQSGELDRWGACPWFAHRRGTARADVRTET
jgi:hypothetical protein